jgi:hypothetical protein
MEEYDMTRYKCMEQAYKTRIFYSYDIPDEKRKK